MRYDTEAVINIQSDLWRVSQQALCLLSEEFFVVLLIKMKNTCSG